VAEHDAIEHLFFGELSGAGFDHHDGVFGTSDGQVQIGFGFLLNGRIDDEFAIDAAHVNAGDRAIKRDVADAKGERSAEHGAHLGRIVGIAGHDGVDELDFVAEAFGE
jgi:hypothetical protein